jgi:hypothetical protein
MTLQASNGHHNEKKAGAKNLIIQHRIMELEESAEEADREIAAIN